MTDDVDRTILDSARYLRAVRPIDPEELSGYVGGDRSAEEVARLLRSRASDLGLIERPDGRFEAASEEPVAVDFEGVNRLPASIDRAIQRILEAEFGDEWASGESGDALRKAIRAFKRGYFAGESVTYDRLTTLGYSIYHLPATFASTHYVLDELGSAGLLPGHLRVLDVGAGVGGQALGLDAYLPANVLIEYTAIEPSVDAIEVLELLLEETGRNFHATIRDERIEALEDPSEPFDLIICANVLNELDRPTETVRQLADHLTDGGSILALEPADERTSRGLRRIERRVSATSELSVFAPTLRLWHGREPSDGCWSFAVKPDIEVPGVQRKLDERPRAHEDDRPPATGEFQNVDVQYSYSILRRDERRRIDFDPTRTTAVPLATASDRVGDRIDVAVVKLSESLADAPDQNPIYVVGDGSQEVEWFAVRTVRTYENRNLREAAYGDVLVISNGLVLWNDDEEAFNLVVDDASLVDRVGR